MNEEGHITGPGALKTFLRNARLQNSRFRTFSEGGKHRKRDPHLSFEYGPSLAFAKNTVVLQSSET